MPKRKIKMADIVRTERSSQTARFLAEDKRDKREKSQKEEQELNKKNKMEEQELEELSGKIERFEKEEIEVFSKEEARGKAKFPFIKKIRLRKFILLILILILIAAGVYGAITFLPRAEIKIITEKSNWQYNNSITAGKNVSSISSADAKIPAEMFEQKKNNNLLFPATGTQEVKRKAAGAIFIYNAYSSSPQPLIANTRFASPDGKIFRLVKGITVPGAKIIEGKIVPSSIESEVIADAAGEEYNIGSVEHFSIPGFKGSAKEQGFYAESKESMTGGFVGTAAVPTDEDIKKAKGKNRQILQQALTSFIYSQMPSGFKIIKDAERFNILKENIKQETDEAGNFSVFSEAKFSIMAFREVDVKNLIQELAKKDLGQGFEPKEYQLDYGVSRTDFDNGKMSFPVNFQGVFWQPLNIGDFQESVKNKREAELRAMVFTLPGVKKVTVSFWPFWVKQVPDDVKRINVVVE